jgi:hypothetical protein
MIRVHSVLAQEGCAPTTEGARPHRAWRALLGICAVVGGCANNDANQVTQPVVLGMTASLGAAYDDGEMQLYQVQVPVRLPIRKAADAEIEGLPDAEPYPRGPYLKASDVRLEVRYTLSNLDDAPHTVLLMLDPWNEFVRYKPGIVVSDEETLPNRSGIERRVRLQGKSRLVGTLTSDDMTELAIDLATAENILKNPPQDPNADVAGIINRAFDIQNRSSEYDPIVSPYIPQVIAGLTGFDLGLRTEEQGTIAVEITIDITDLNGQRVIPADDNTTRKIAVPDTVISPPGARLLN